MKKLVLGLIVLCAIGLNAQTFFYADSIKSTDTSNVHVLYRYLEAPNKEYDFVTIKITLSSANDSVYVKTSCSDMNSFGKVGLTDQLTGGDVQLITGNTDANRGYLLKYAPRAAYINIYSNDLSLGGTIKYKIEAR